MTGEFDIMKSHYSFALFRLFSYIKYFNVFKKYFLMLIDSSLTNGQVMNGLKSLVCEL